MDQNRLGDEAMSCLANAAMKSKKLASLSLHSNCGGNGFGRKAAEAFGVLLSLNQVLNSLTP